MDFPIKNGGSFHSYVKLPVEVVHFSTFGTDCSVGQGSFLKAKFSMRCCPSGQRWAGGSTKKSDGNVCGFSWFQHCHEISHVTSLLFMVNFPMFI